MPIPIWMSYALYGNAALDVAIFISPSTIAIPDYISAKFASSSDVKLEELKAHFYTMGGYSFLLHGAVRAMTGYYKNQQAAGLAIFSYLVEVAQILYFLRKGAGKKSLQVVAGCVFLWSMALGYFAFGE